MLIPNGVEHTNRGRELIVVGDICCKALPTTHGSDFDLNVVIRSIFYNAATRYLSIRVGSAITYDSTPEQEWQEVMLKAERMVEVLRG